MIDLLLYICAYILAALAFAGIGWLVALVAHARNPFCVEPYGYAPVQADGTLPTGEWFYFRSRHKRWSIEIATSEQAWGQLDTLWSYSEFIADASSLEHAEAIRLATFAIRKYYRDTECKRAR